MRLPIALAFAVTATGAIAGSVASCGDDAPACELHCEAAFPVPNDAGGFVDSTAASCPDCADPVTLECPTGCEPVG